MVAYITISAVFFIFFMVAVGIGVIVRGRTIKGHCSGTGSCACDNGPPEHSVSTCKRRIHVPQK